MDSLGKIVSILIATVVLFFAPFYYMSQRQDDISQLIVTKEVSYFVDSVRNLGYLSKGMYETFLRRLQMTGNIYEIEMEQIEYYLFGEGNPIINEKKLYKDDILKSLYETDDIYNFSKGDYFSIKVVNMNKTWGQKLKQSILKSGELYDGIYVVYGGMIRDETY